MDPNPTSSGPSHVSVTGPISTAIARVEQVLFRPFDIGKWFTLGFCAWLAWLGQNGSGGSGSNWNEPDFDPVDDFGNTRDWVLDNLQLVIGIAAVVLTIIVGLVVLITWLSSRGKFMFLDGVVHNRGAVVEPWRRFKTQANSLLGFRLVMVLIASVTLSLVAGLAVLNLMNMGIHQSDPGSAVFVVLGFWVCLFVALALGFGLIGMVANDFVVPIMWLRGCRVEAALLELRDVLSPQMGTFFLYVLLKFLMGVIIVVISCITACVTCCIAALPYVGTVLLLPLFVFRRSYSMHFLSQLDVDYTAFGPGGQSAPVPSLEPGEPVEPAGPTDPPTGPTEEDR